MTRGLRNERGETLLELLITLTIMGGVVIAILAGIAVAADTSDENKKEIGAEVVLRDYAEAVMGATYSPCVAGVVGSGVPTNIVYTAPAGYAVSTPVVTGCYDGTSTSGGYSGGAGKGAVRLRLEAHSTDTSGPHQRTKSLEIVKAADYERPS